MSTAQDKAPALRCELAGVAATHVFLSGPALGGSNMLVPLQRSWPLFDMILARKRSPVVMAVLAAKQGAPHISLKLLAFMIVR